MTYESVVTPAIVPVPLRLSERPNPALLAGAADAGARPPVTAPVTAQTNGAAPRPEHVADGTTTRRELPAQTVRGKRVATVSKRGLTKSLSSDAHDQQEDIAGF
jgi:hypothetical protein